MLGWAGRNRDIADHVGTKSEEECRVHYKEEYMDKRIGFADASDASGVEVGATLSGAGASATGAVPMDMSGSDAIIDALGAGGAGSTEKSLLNGVAPSSGGAMGGASRTATAGGSDDSGMEKDAEEAPSLATTTPVEGYVGYGRLPLTAYDRLRPYRRGCTGAR